MNAPPGIHTITGSGRVGCAGAQMFRYGQFSLTRPCTTYSGDHGPMPCGARVCGQLDAKCRARRMPRQGRAPCKAVIPDTTENATIARSGIRDRMPADRENACRSG